MQGKLWDFDLTQVDLEDGDASATARRIYDGTSIRINFRLSPADLALSTAELRQRIIDKAAVHIEDLQYYLHTTKSTPAEPGK